MKQRSFNIHLHRRRPARWCCSIALLCGMVVSAALLTTGCQRFSTAEDSATRKISLLTDSKITDFRTVACDNIWTNQDSETLENPLFWLRMMDCSSILSRDQSRALVAAYPMDSWHQTFKHGILLSDIGQSISERQDLLNKLNEYRTSIPFSLRPLMQLWREQQTVQLALQEERKRYRQLEANTDSKIDALKVQESQLRHLLMETSRKLSSLTEIERQLSSRKQLQGESPVQQEAGETGIEEGPPPPRPEIVPESLSTPPAEQPLSTKEALPPPIAPASAPVK